MRKSIFILALTLIAIVSFSTESFAQKIITLQNGTGTSIDIKLCSTLKTLAAGEVHSTKSTCLTAPCFIEVITPCTGAVTINVPCTGTGPYTLSQTISGSGSLPCTIQVDYSYDTITGDINITVQ